MSSEAKKNVKKWLPAIRDIRKDMGLTEKQYPDELVLSIIWVESDPKGDPNSHRPGSQYHGLLQMGRPPAIDLGYPDKGKQSSAFLMGDGYAAIKHFYQYQELYVHPTKDKPYAGHEYDPRLIALNWKGGPGTVRRYKRILDEEGEDAALDYLGTLWGGSAREYVVDKFEPAYRMWSSGDGEAVASVPERDHSGKYVKNSTTSLPPGCSQAEIGEASPRSPLPQPRRQSVDEDAHESSRRGTKRVLEYVDKNYQKDLNAFLQTSKVASATSNHWDDSHTRAIQGFVDRADGGELAFTFKTALLDVATTFVKPLVDPVVRNDWGQPRGYAAGPRNENGERQALTDPETGEKLKRRHLGVDYETRSSHGSRGKNQPCYAIADGTVVRAGGSKSYGNVIYIEHEGGVSSRYAHLNKMYVSEGDTVEAGQKIALCGASEGTDYEDKEGWYVEKNKDSVIPHLHFELRFNIGMLQEGKMRGSVQSNQHNVSINPVPLLESAPNPGEPVEETDPELVRLQEARDNFARLAVNAGSKTTEVEAADKYDMTSGYERGVQISMLSRYDFYDAQAKNTRAQTRKAVNSSSSAGNFGSSA